MTADIAVGLNSVGISLINPPVFSSTVSNSNGNTLFINTDLDIGSLLDANIPYYIEVISGTAIGERFDLDVSETINSGLNSIVLDILNPNNTTSFDAVVDDLLGVSIRLIPHTTISQVQSSIVGELVGNNNPALADQISFFDNSTNGFISVFLRADGVTWRRVGTPILANLDTIAPGQGFFFIKRNNPVSLVISGNVRLNAFAQNLESGLQLVSTPFPIPLSPNMLGASSANGWVGNNNPSLADNIAVFDPVTNGYITYFLRGDGVTWRIAGSPTNVSDEAFMLPNQSFFIIRNNPDNFLFLPPFSPDL